MKVSTKSRYGLRAIIVLAEYYNIKSLTIKEISKKENISLKYLESIFTVLRNAGFITGTRGASGGYSLAIDPGKINLFELLTALEGNLTPVECIINPQLCKKHSICATIELWKEIYNKTADLLKNKTLADLLSVKMEKKSGQFNIYYI